MDAPLPAADPIETARALLPSWVPWGGLAYFPLAFAMGFALAWAATIGAYRVPATAHWTEKARHAYAARLPVTLCAVLVFVFALAFTPLWYDGVLGRVPVRLVMLGTAIAAVQGTSVAQSRVERRIGPATPALARLRGNAALAFVMFPHAFVAWIFSFLEIGETGLSFAVTFAAGVVAVVLAFCGGGLLAARVLGLARPPTARLVAAVDEAARRAGTRSRPVYELVWHRANALAFPHLGRLAFTGRAVAILDDDELRAVAAHELAHLDEPRVVRALRVAVGLVTAFAILTLPLVGDLLGPAGPLVVIAGTLLVVMLFRRLARRMEERADAAAHSTEHGDSQVYARALERIYEANLVPAVLRRRTVHPHLYDRMVSAGVQPPYPRPAPPPLRRWALAVVIVSPLVLMFATILGGKAVRGTEPGVLASIALTGGEPWQVGALAYVRHEARDYHGAAALYRAEADLGVDFAFSNLAIALSNEGRCEDAHDALARFHEAQAKAHTRTKAPAPVAERAVADCASKTARRDAK
jgi:Zn-dependent protease with chaperone function